MVQKSKQQQLPLERGGEAPRVERRGQATSATTGKGSTGTGALMGLALGEVGAERGTLCSDPKAWGWRAHAQHPCGAQPPDSAGVVAGLAAGPRRHLFGARLRLSFTTWGMNAGVIANDVGGGATRGHPQGGSVSPSLTRVFLDEVDKELEQRGHALVR